MAAPFPLPDRMKIIRPFGGVTVVAADVPCRWVPSLFRGESVGDSSVETRWTGGVDCESDIDVRDGCQRTGGSSYPTFTDGDQVELVLAGLTWVFVVTWVEVRYSNTPGEYKRAYLCRDHVVGW